MTPDDAIKLAEQIETETRYRQQLGREMYEAGLADGYRAGFEAAYGERDAEHARWYREHGRHLAERPTHAELEERRWGPGGREHYGDPRPGDYPGRRAQAEAEADSEIEEMEMTA